MKMERKTSTSNVFHCDATYYNAATKKWESGTFTLTQNHVQFTHSTEAKDQFHLCLPLSTITEIEKRQSAIVYPSLVVSVGSEKHWFASFGSRDNVYNMLELFWRESLISKTHITTSSKKSLSNSSLGKELFNLLHESECTLIETANTLADQSQQLDEAEQDVEDLNDNLAKAKEAINNLSSPVPLTLFQKKFEESKNSEQRLQKYQVTFSFSNSEDKVDWEKGTLIITTDTILLKVEEKVIIQVTKDELESFEVLSPWELGITHSLSDLQKTCFCMCPQLSRLLKFVSSIPHYRRKILYADDNSSYDTASCSSRSLNGSVKSSPTSPGAQSRTSKKSFDDSQTQLNTLTEEDIEELNSVLQNLQTLAAKVSSEQESQLQRIDILTESMEKTEIKMKNVDNVTKKQN